MRYSRSVPVLRWALLSCLSATLLRLAVGCGSAEPQDIQVLVHVPAVPSDAATLSVLASLDGKMAMQPFSISDKTQFARFGVRLPLDKSGSLSLSIDVVDANSCKLGNAQAATQIGPPLQAEISATLTLLGQRQCPPPPQPMTCSPALFCWSNPLPQGNPIRGMFALSATDVWAVGDAGTVLRYNGTAWSAVPSGVSETLNAVWAASANDVFAVGEGGRIIHWNGTAFAQQTSNVTANLLGLWGTNGNNVIAVGEGGTIVRYVGAWTPQGSGVTSTLNAVWGTGLAGATQFMAVGAGGVIRAYDGTMWNNLASSTTQDLRGIFGTAMNQAFAVGANGTIISWNGTWSTSTAAQAVQLNAVWGSSASDYWAVGAGGSRQHWNGSNWMLMTGGDTVASSLNAVSGSGASVSSGGDNGLLLHYNGTAWLSRTQGSQQLIRSIYGFSPKDIWAVGAGGLAMHYDGTAWTAVSSATTNTLNSIWGSAANDIWAVGDNRTVVRYNGTRWAVQSLGVADMQHLQGVWGSSAIDVWIVGISANPQVQHIVRFLNNSEGGFTLMATAPQTVPPFFTVWGSSAQSIWVGGQTLIYNIFDGGTMFQFSPYPVSTTVRSMWGSRANDVYAVGDGGFLQNFAGSGFSTVGPGSTQDLLGVWGSSDKDVWVVGNRGTALKFDGTTWTAPQSGTTNQLFSVWGLNNLDVWAGGIGGSILHTLR